MAKRELRAKQGREDSAAGKAFVDFVQRNEPSQPCLGCLLNESVHAARASPWVHDAPITHSPEERVAPEDCPLDAFQRCHRRTEGSLDGELGPRIVLLLVLCDSDALSHRDLWRPSCWNWHGGAGATPLPKANAFSKSTQPPSDIPLAREGISKGSALRSPTKMVGWPEQQTLASQSTEVIN